jgi:general secretion pathway protein J
MTAATPRKADVAGFTLIEMIVALALLSLVMGLLASTVRSSRHVLAVIDRNNMASAIVPVQSYLLSSFAQIVPPQLNRASTDRKPSLLGDAASVRFTTFHAPQGQIDGLYNVELHLVSNGDRASLFDLVATHTLFRPTTNDAKDVPVQRRRSILASNISAITFSYFGTVDGEPNTWRWLDTWSSVDRLPRLVRINVKLAQGPSQNWQQLKFPLQLAD